MMLLVKSATIIWLKNVAIESQEWLILRCYVSRASLQIVKALCSFLKQTNGLTFGPVVDKICCKFPNFVCLEFGIR